ncbi:MAG TPA: hypothetical protein ENI04_00750, partial [Candidatus Wildermuthbacteria bacterium]|nr:hypothetical protein [Candidatus Wildermuthbacteria bacterium]
MLIKKRIFRSLQTVLAHKTILFIGVLVLFMVFAPFNTVEADWWNPNTWGDSIVKGLTTIIITMLTFIPATIFFLISGLVTWILQTVLSIGIIPGATGTPEFVKVGWELSRDFINILFLLILVFIGLATTLRLETYQYKKTLPALIGVALLINFSGVFVGMIVDISNIITNFFLIAVGQFGGDTFSSIFTTGSN